MLCLPILTYIFILINSSKLKAEDGSILTSRLSFHSALTSKDVPSFNTAQNVKSIRLRHGTTRRSHRLRSSRIPSSANFPPGSEFVILNKRKDGSPMRELYCVLYLAHLQQILWLQIHKVDEEMREFFVYYPPESKSKVVLNLSGESSESVRSFFSRSISDPSKLKAMRHRTAIGVCPLSVVSVIHEFATFPLNYFGEATITHVERLLKRLFLHAEQPAFIKSLFTQLLHDPSLDDGAFNSEVRFATELRHSAMDGENAENNGLLHCDSIIQANSIIAEMEKMLPQFEEKKENYVTFGASVWREKFASQPKAENFFYQFEVHILFQIKEPEPSLLHSFLHREKRKSAPSQNENGRESSGKNKERSLRRRRFFRSTRKEHSETQE